MKLREVYALAKQFNAALKARPIGKAARQESLCGIVKIWALPVSFPWYQAGLCQAHDLLFDEAKETLRYVQLWWIREAWKASPTWRLRLFYVLTLGPVLSWTAARYEGPR